MALKIVRKTITPPVFFLIVPVTTTDLQQQNSLCRTKRVGCPRSEQQQWRQLSKSGTSSSRTKNFLQVKSWIWFDDSQIYQLHPDDRIWPWSKLYWDFWESLEFSNWKQWQFLSLTLVLFNKIHVCWTACLLLLPVETILDDSLVWLMNKTYFKVTLLDLYKVVYIQCLH